MRSRRTITLAHHGARQHQTASDPAITSADAFRSPARSSPEELERLGEEIATLAAQLHAGTYRLLVRLREFDERAGWNCGGFLSCAQWLSWRTGIGPGAAREKVRVAHALAPLPQVAAAMEQGELSFAKVRAITRVATPESETDLLEVARHGSAVQVEKVVRAWRVVDRLAEANRERARHEQRHLTLRLDEDGAYVLRGRLAPEVGALLERALAVVSRALAGDQQPEASRVASQALAGDEQGQASGEATAERDRSTAEQRRADALGLLVELALRSAETSQEILAATRGADEHEAVVDRPAAARSEHEDVARRDHATAPDVAGATSPRARAVRSLGRAGRVQVVLHVDAEALREGAESGHAVLDNGVGVPAGTSRRLACDATRVVMTHDPTGRVLDVGHRTRVIPTPIHTLYRPRTRDTAPST